MREWYRDIVYGLTLVIASFTAYLTWRGPQPADPPIVSSVVQHPVAGLVLVATLFLIAGALNFTPLLLRLFPSKKIAADSTENDDLDFKQLFLDEQLARDKYQDQFVNVREERDQLSRQLEQLKARESGTPSQRVFFVCANGYPLQRTQSGIALNLQILSSVPTKLAYAKATLTLHDQKQTRQIELESSEPHIIPAMQMLPRMLEIKLGPEEAKRFMGPNVEITGQLKLEENNTHRVSQFQLLTHRECPEDTQLPELRTKLHEAETRLASLSKPPDDLHLQLLCFQVGTTLSLEETAYFIRLKISCDEDTGIRAIKISLTIGTEVFTAEPMDSGALSEWLIHIPAKSITYPHKTFSEEEATSHSLWDELQRDGLRSGIVKEGWMGIKINKGILQSDGPSQMRIDIIKSKDRNPLPFIFSTLSECEGFHVLDRAYRER
jgi:hypothetical protein